MRHLDEGTIHAWLDGALSADEAARAEAHVASCPTCADAVAEARGFIAASSRILTALDEVPSIKGARGANGAKGAGGARWGGRSLSTWLVRERIAAVVALVVAGGALALVLGRPTEEAALADLASEPVRTFELAAADSPAPSEAGAAGLRNEAPVPLPAASPAAPAAPPGARDLTSARQAESAPPTVAMPQQATPRVTTDAVAAPLARTDDTLRSVTVASTQRVEADQRSVEGKSAVTERISGTLERRRTAEAPSRFAEPLAVSPSVGQAAGAAAPGGEARLVQEERMVEGGRQVRRRIYRVEGLLVTLDERLPVAVEGSMRAQGANAPLADSTAGTTAIHWTNASGTEFTLRGPVPRERLERIRKLLGY